MGANLKHLTTQDSVEKEEITQNVNIDYSNGLDRFFGSFKIFINNSILTKFYVSKLDSETRSIIFSGSKKCEIGITKFPL